MSRTAMRHTNFPIRAVVVLAALAIATTIAGVAALLWQLRLRDLEHSARESASLAGLLVEQSDEVLAGPELALRSVEERLETPFGRSLQPGSDEVHLLLSARISGMPQVSALSLAGPDGRVLNSSRPDRGGGRYIGDRHYFRVLAANPGTGLILDRAERGLATGAWTLHMARRVEGPAGQFQGIVVASIELSRFEQLYSHMQIDHTRPIALYLSDGSLLASYPHREGDIGDAAAELKGVALPAQPGTVQRTRRTLGDALPATLAVGRSAGFPLIVSVFDDSLETLAAWRETAIKIGLGALLLEAFLAVAAVSLVAQLQRDQALAQALGEADQRYQQMLDNTMDAVITIDERQHILQINPSAERMFGLAADQAIGQTLDLLLPAAAREAHRSHVASLAHAPAQSRPMAPHMEVMGRHASGNEFPIESTITTTSVAGQLQFTAVLRDISERRRNEEALRALNDELRRLSSVLQSVREQERQRIALELHDELGQQLTGIKLEMSWVASRVRDGRPLDPATIDEMRQMLDASIAAVRRISTELRPSILDERDFGAAVRWQAAEFTRRSGVAVSLDLPASSLVRRPELATALFRIVQEALTNVARHAQARQVAIRLVNDEARLDLCIEDDGKGLDNPASQGIGLVGMRERACALGGQFQASTRPGGGTRIAVSIPLAANEDAEMPA